MTSTKNPGTIERGAEEQTPIAAPPVWGPEPFAPAARPGGAGRVSLPPIVTDGCARIGISTIASNVCCVSSSNLPSVSWKFAVRLGHLLASVEPAYGVGVEISERLVEVAQQNYPQLHFVTSDPEDLQLDETFDYVIFSHLFRHG